MRGATQRLPPSGDTACLEVAATVETVGAHLFFRQAYGFHERFYGIEAQRSQSETLSYFLHHALVFGRARRGIGFEVFVLIALQILDDSAGNKFH